jgi:uncharacterized membrane protein HdeD (DUF308 family)
MRLDLTPLLLENMMNPRTIVVVSGAFLIIVGVALIVVQFWLYATTPGFQPPSRSLNLEAVGTQAEVRTTYVGLALVLIGAFLEAMALFVRRTGSDR